jgi:hypothetical protein
MQTVPSGNYNVTHKRIYRINVADSGAADYQLVTELTAATTTYGDTTASASLGALIPSKDYDPPPSDLHSLIVLPNGGMAGASGNRLCFSEPGIPHAWPVGYRLPTDKPIVGLAAVGSLIAVPTTGSSWVASGVDPRSVAMEDLETPYPCASKRGVVDMGYSVLYPSPDGLVAVKPGALPELVTGGILKAEDWRALKPSSIHAYRWKDNYIGFYDTGAVTGGFLIDPMGAGFTYLNIYYDSGYTDPVTGELYVNDGQAIHKFDAGAALTGKWKSREEIVHRPVNLSCARLVADAYPVTFRLYGNGSLLATRTVTSSRPFKLPTGTLNDRFQSEIEGPATMRRLEVAESMAELSRL